MTSVRSILAPGCALLALCLSPPAAHPFSFSLDDNPSAPVGGPPGVGFGAEDPYGLTPGPGLAPSPTLGVVGAPDGAIFAPGPVVQAVPNGAYVDSLSRNHVPGPQPLRLEFSVDRLSVGLPGSAVSVEAAAGQQPGDIFRTTKTFASPAGFVGGLLAGPGYVGPLFVAGPPGSNVIAIPDTAMPLLCGAACPGPGVPVAPPMPATHDNVDAFDGALFDVLPGPPDGLFDIDAYFTIYPDEALAVGLSPADIVHVPAGAPGAVPVPWASAATAGLLSPPAGPPPLGALPPSDSIDALIVWDSSTIGGTVEPGIDFALFSLAPGSLSLGVADGLGGVLDDADVFFTDFSGAFALYAAGTDLGLLGGDGVPFSGLDDNVDALHAQIVPLPPSWVILLLAFAPLLAARRSTRQVADAA